MQCLLSSGGFTAAAYTDAIQATIMIVGTSIMLFIGLDKVGGWSRLMESVPEAMHIAKPYDDPVYPFWGILATIFVIDQFIGTEAGEMIFPFLHYKLTLNFGYRGLWATLLITIILFAVSAITPKTDPFKLQKKTINYSKRVEKFAGLSDWRFHLLILSIITILLYLWLR